jgi:hypothetical protein
MRETFWTLLRDPAHWEFEIFLMILKGMIVTKKRRKAFRHGDISRALAVVFVLDIRLGPVI